MNNFRIVKEYIKYYLRAKTKHSVHSPFIFEFVTKVLKNGTGTNELLREIEKLRRDLLASEKVISVLDFGASSESARTYTRKVSEIVKCSAKKKKYAGLLYNIISYYNLKNILELGTSAGISSMYLAAASPCGKVITLEGCPETAALAGENFNRLKFTNIIQATGSFDEILPGIIKQQSMVDCVFFDGNHKEIATLKYFEECLPYINNNSIFIFDDINWSEGMKRAWNNIKEHSSVTVTVDLFFLGIVFFRKELSKENFVIRY